MISRSSAKDADEPLAEINVTPLVDVMLVLVVILLVMAPMLTSSLHIDLPKVAGSASEARERAVTISLDARGRLAIDGRDIAADQLDSTLRLIAARNDQTVLNLRSDQSQPFGAVANLLAKISRAGIAHVAVITANGEQRN
jgi:biopolymer transport protein ExbD